MSYTVTERTHEIGIRMALGAERGEVLALMQLGLKLTLIGVAMGTGMAIGLTHLIRGLLYGVKPTDPLTLVAITWSSRAPPSSPAHPRPAGRPRSIPWWR